VVEGGGGGGDGTDRLPDGGDGDQKPLRLSGMAEGEVAGVLGDRTSRAGDDLPAEGKAMPGLSVDGEDVGEVAGDREGLWEEGGRGNRLVDRGEPEGGRDGGDQGSDEGEGRKGGDRCRLPAPPWRLREALRNGDSRIVAEWGRAKGKGKERDEHGSL